MKIGNRNVKVLKSFVNKGMDLKVELTRKMTVKGKIIYAVVTTDTRTGVHADIAVYDDGIFNAYKLYKAKESLYKPLDTDTRAKVGRDADGVALAMLEKGFETVGLEFKRWEGDYIVFTPMQDRAA